LLAIKNSKIVLNSKYRFVYLLIGFSGVIGLAYLIVDTYPFIDPGYVLLIAAADMVFFFLAYKTYPL